MSNEANSVNNPPDKSQPPQSSPSFGDRVIQPSPDFNPNQDNKIHTVDIKLPVTTNHENNVQTVATTNVYSGPIETNARPKSHLPLYIGIAAISSLLLIFLLIGLAINNYYKGLFTSATNHQSTPSAPKPVVPAAPKDPILKSTALRAAPTGYKQYGTPCYQVSVPQVNKVFIQEKPATDPSGQAYAHCIMLSDRIDSDPFIVINQMDIGSKDIFFDRSGSGCEEARKKLNDSAESIEIYCSTEKFAYQKVYHLTGSKSKVGNYDNSARGTILISVTGKSKDTANTLADDLYERIGPP